LFPYISSENIPLFQGEQLAPYFGLDVACGCDPEGGYLTCHNTTAGFKIKVICISLQPFPDVLLVKEDCPLVACQWTQWKGLFLFLI